MSNSNVKSKWKSGNLYFYDKSGNEIFYIDGTNRKMVFPSGSELDIDGTLTSALIGDVTGNAAGYALKSEARTATTTGATTGTISAGVTHVVVTCDNADKIIILPAPVVGLKLTLLNAGTGYEIRSSAPGTIAINGGTGATAESDVGANITVKLECVSATAWIGSTVTTAGVVGVLTVAA